MRRADPLRLRETSEAGAGRGAGAALAAEGCDCCKDMAADAPMSCCDEMKTEPAPTAPAPPAPAPSDTPAPQGHADHN